MREASGPRRPVLRGRILARPAQLSFQSPIRKGKPEKEPHVYEWNQHQNAECGRESSFRKDFGPAQSKENRKHQQDTQNHQLRKANLAAKHDSSPPVFRIAADSSTKSICYLPDRQTTQSPPEMPAPLRGLLHPVLCPNGNRAEYRHMQECLCHIIQTSLSIPILENRS